MIESMTLDQNRFTRDQYVDITLMETTHLVLSAAMRDQRSQIVDVQTVYLSEGGIRLFPLRYRYYTAAELDDLAARAGLRLVARHGNWERAEESPEQKSFISVYALVR